ncbi:dihydroorotate dehydrogenase electron transfer subunit [Paenalkalicoccus suaedae]|uniref:Dihydroorotate dehydrogenase B (NAD(+)), electron transfer subunit n=2 Tax=Paenalkalicoccus suaedae TaxID=2592382 RepID=A0A859FKE6_9BACI|nr:dihydroorotate dehydrogenase electron transfer subunit [Paenalkalicoccus suaedae]
MLSLEVTSNRFLTSDVVQMELTSEQDLGRGSVGKFIHIDVGRTLRRPISICEVDGHSLTIVYRIEGTGTAWLSERQSGEVLNALGPLGSGYPIMKSGKALLVGGGIGIPPLLQTAKELASNGVQVTTILGFRSEPFLVEEFATYSDVHVVTEDGSHGTKGFVTDVMDAFTYDTFYSCGPRAMLQAVKQRATSPGYLSLEERMGCGVGACLACVCDKADGTYAKVCTDGPVFESEEVVL